MRLDFQRMPQIVRSQLYVFQLDEIRRESGQASSFTSSYLLVVACKKSFLKLSSSLYHVSFLMIMTMPPCAVPSGCVVWYIEQNGTLR
jgi:hypothetical protein